MHILEGRAGKILTATSGFIARCGFDYTLNPADGCAFGCSYCYAAAFTQERSPGPAWGQWTRLKVNAGQLIREAAPLCGKSIYLSSVTDPYQPAERHANVTRGILEALAEHHPGVILVVQTRGPLVTRDLDLLTRIDFQGRVQVNLTLSTDSDALRRRFEPTCPSVHQRLEAARALLAAGLKVVITVTPMLPLENVEGFADCLAGLGLAGVVLQPFHDTQAGKKMVRGTREGALGVLDELGLTQRDLKDQGNALWKALRARGVQVGTNETGFHLNFFA